MLKTLAATLPVVLLLASDARAQTAPDLTGAWTNASVTRLTRPPSRKLVVSPAEAAAIAKADPLVRLVEADAKPSDIDDDLLADGNTGNGYNAYWIDAGSTLAKVRGEHRTSWLVDPPDGQLPYSEAGRARLAKLRSGSRADAPDGPEALAPWDRCLISSRGAGGPGMLNTIYNSNYQIVDTPGAVAIVVEQVHDARIIPIFPDRVTAVAAHGAVPRWLGDSVGWREGATLVIETTLVDARQGEAGPIHLSPQGRVTERLTRTGPEEIFYEFTVEDPAWYTRPWRAEMTLTALNGPVYEFACHEGNYALSGILAGARAADAKAAGAGGG